MPINSPNVRPSSVDSPGGEPMYVDPFADIRATLAAHNVRVAAHEARKERITGFMSSLMVGQMVELEVVQSSEGAQNA